MIRPATALGALVWGQPIFLPHSADFKKRTITLECKAKVAFDADTTFVVLPAQAVHDALVADAGAVVFPSPRPDDEVYFYDGDKAGAYLSIHVGNGFDLTLFRDHVPDVGREEYWKGPGAWYGSETRKDITGRSWRSSVGPLVTDDFGTLVPAGAQ